MGNSKVYSDEKECQKTLPLIESSKNSAMSSVFTESELWANTNSCYSEKHNIKHLCDINAFNNKRRVTEERGYISRKNKKNVFPYPVHFCEWWP